MKYTKVALAVQAVIRMRREDTQLANGG